MTMRIAIISVLISITTCAHAGGGWPQPKKHGYFKLSQNLIMSPYFFNPAGEIIEITTIGMHTTSFYAEYGITNRVTAQLYFPFLVSATQNAVQFRQSGRMVAGDSFTSVGDTDVGLKYALITGKPVVLAASLVLGLPLGATSGGATQILQTGDGEFNQMIRVDASHSFYPKNIYASVYAAWNNRTRGFSDEVRWGVEVGATLKKFIPIFKLNAVHSLFNGTTAEAQNGIFSNNTEYLSPALEINYGPSKSWGISASAGFALSGRNILASPNWGLGVYLNL
jgi:hypothetical protein